MSLVTEPGYTHTQLVVHTEKCMRPIPTELQTLGTDGHCGSNVHTHLLSLIFSISLSHTHRKSLKLPDKYTDCTATLVAEGAI